MDPLAVAVDPLAVAHRIVVFQVDPADEEGALLLAAVGPVRTGLAWDHVAVLVAFEGRAHHFLAALVVGQIDVAVVENHHLVVQDVEVAPVGYHSDQVAGDDIPEVVALAEDLYGSPVEVFLLGHPVVLHTSQTWNSLLRFAVLRSSRKHHPRYSWLVQGWLGYHRQIC